MKTIGEILRDHWRDRGVAVHPGLPEADIQAFEQRYQVALPGDFRNYFAVVNGTDYLGDGDERVFLSLPARTLSEEVYRPSFSYVKPYARFWEGTDRKYPITPQDELDFVFVDVNLMSAYYAIRLTADPQAPAPIHFFGEPEPWFGSFTEFANAYLENRLPL